MFRCGQTIKRHSRIFLKNRPNPGGPMKLQCISTRPLNSTDFGSYVEEIFHLKKILTELSLAQDMNEVSNFDTNLYPDKLACPESRWDDPPYETMAAHIGPKMRLSDRTICMSTKQGAYGQYYHYDVHNLYGYSQAVATQRYWLDMVEWWHNCFMETALYQMQYITLHYITQ